MWKLFSHLCNGSKTLFWLFHHIYHYWILKQQWKVILKMIKICWIWPHSSSLLYQNNDKSILMASFHFKCLKYLNWPKKRYYFTYISKFSPEVNPYSFPNQLIMYKANQNSILFSAIYFNWNLYCTDIWQIYSLLPNTQTHPWWTFYWSLAKFVGHTNHLIGGNLLQAKSHSMPGRHLHWGGGD